MIGSADGEDGLAESEQILGWGWSATGEALIGIDLNVGGVIEHHLWELEVECFPQDVPTSIEADISRLGINESLKVGDLTVPPNCVILTPKREAVVSVVPPQVLKVEEEVAAAVEGEEAVAEAEGATGEEAGEQGDESEEG